MARILLIDDEPDLVAFVANVLERRGHQVTAVLSGLFVLLKINEPNFRDAFDAVITDLIMPDVEGLEVIRMIRAACPRTKVIAISGGGKYGAASDYLRIAKRFGADATLAKPFAIADLCSAIDLALCAAVDRAIGASESPRSISPSAAGSPGTPL